MKTLSVIIPCYNEEVNISHFYKAFMTAWSDPRLSKLDYELVFIDDGSRDQTVAELQKLIAQDSKVKLIEFSRNFGKEVALSAGVENCIGDGAIFVDADLQYPIDRVPDFVEKWLSGADVVVGIRDKKKTNNLIEKFGSSMFYKIINSISDTKIIPGALDFRLIDRVVIDEYNRFSERGRMTRALIDWLGFKRDYIHYQELPRLYGEPAYSFSKRVKLALSTFVSQSLLPLKLAGYLGLLIFIISGLLGIFIIVQSYILGDPLNLRISGSASLGILNSFMVSIILMCLGLIALYIANIHTEVANRPLYVVRKIYQKTAKKTKA